MGVNTLLELDEFDRQVLHALQYDFAVAERPYREIAEKFQTTEEAVLARAERLYAKGFIRRLGASINSRKVGYVSTLVALKVTENSIATVAKVVNGFAGVTHNYLRDGEYNMWFTAIMPNEESLNTVLHTVAATSGVEDVMSLPAKRVFKVSVKFPLVAG